MANSVKRPHRSITGCVGRALMLLSSALLVMGQSAQGCATPPQPNDPNVGVPCGHLGEVCCTSNPPCLENTHCSDGGRCEGPCAVGQFVCEGRCINSDDANCGGCGRKCEEGFECVSPSGAALQPGSSSTCVCRAGAACSCTAAQSFCPGAGPNGSGACVDLTTDANNCQSCGHSVDVNSDPKHCGGCGKACPDGKRCSDGICLCPIGQKDCDGTCRRACCTDDQTECNGRCVNLDSDGANCGRCGNHCTNGCEAGACVRCEDRCDAIDSALDRCTCMNECGHRPLEKCFPD